MPSPPSAQVEASRCPPPDWRMLVERRRRLTLDASDVYARAQESLGVAAASADLPRLPYDLDAHHALAARIARSDTCATRTMPASELRHQCRPHR